MAAELFAAYTIAGNLWLNTREGYPAGTVSPVTVTISTTSNPSEYLLTATDGTTTETFPVRPYDYSIHGLLSDGSQLLAWATWLGGTISVGTYRMVADPYGKRVPSQPVEGS